MFYVYFVELWTDRARSCLGGIRLRLTTYAIRRAYPGVDDSLEPALGLRLSRAWGGGRGAAIFYLALGLAACELALHARGAYRTYYGISRTRA